MIREVAALTPGPYLHIGGDEASVTPADQYAAFLNRVQPLVIGQGKAVLGWQARPVEETILETARSLVAHGVVKG